MSKSYLIVWVSVGLSGYCLSGHLGGQAIALEQTPAADTNSAGPVEGKEAKSPASAEPKAAPPAQPAGTKAELPPGVVARVNGRDITMEEYVNYLLATFGKSKLDEYVNRLLLDDEARRLGIQVEPQQVEAAVEDRVERTIKSMYQGNKDAYVQALLRRQTNLDDEKVRLRQELYYDTLWKQAALKIREVTEEDLRRQFEKTYGEGGVQYVLRHILVSTRGAAVKEGEKDSGGARRTPGEAKERAEKILAEIKGGLSFTQAVKQYSDDTFTRRNDGRIPYYRKGAYGDKFHAAVEQLTQEKPLSDVVESPRGYHIIELVEKRVTKFDDVKADVEKSLKERPPSYEDKQKLLLKLREKAKIEGL